MNLIPNDYRRCLIIERVLRRFIYVCVFMLLIVVLAKGFLQYLIWHENEQMIPLRKQQQVLQNNFSKAENYLQQKQVVQQQITVLNKLRGYDRVTTFLKAIDSAYTKGLWFDDLRFTRSTRTNVADDTPAIVNEGVNTALDGVEKEALMGISHSAEINGRALNHTVLADFMRNLSAENSVTDLHLLNTVTKNYLEMQVVDFNLILKINTEKKKQS